MSYPNSWPQSPYQSIQICTSRIAGSGLSEARLAAKAYYAGVSCKNQKCLSDTCRKWSETWRSYRQPPQLSESLPDATGRHFCLRGQVRASSTDPASSPSQSMGGNSLDNNAPHVAPILLGAAVIFYKRYKENDT